jgi:hypothetical protein
LVRQDLATLVNDRHNQSAGPINLDPVSANMFAHKVRMVCARVSVCAHLIFGLLCRSHLAGHAVSILLGLDLCHPLVMLKALGKRHGTASVCYPLGFKHWLLPTAGNAHRHFATGVQDVPTVKRTLLR